MRKPRRHLSPIVFILFILAASPAFAQDDLESRMTWQNLPPLPQAVGGPFAGTVGDSLLVAGGSYWPALPTEGGVKAWSDPIYLLGPDAKQWQPAGTLPSGRAHGACVTTKDGVVCIGGSNGKQHFRDVFLLYRQGNDVRRRDLPPLPKPCAYMTAALLDDTVYVAGGQEAPDPSPSLHTFWSLDLAKGGAWQELDPWPGSSRILPVVAAQDGSIYVIGGAELFPKDDGKFDRRYTSDGYRYTPGQGWKRITDCPQPVVAATAVPIGPSHVYVFGGDDGLQAQVAPEQHKGFHREVHAYHTITDTWFLAGLMPEAPVATAAVLWRDRIVLPGGEDRPYHRSASVLGAHIQSGHRSVFALDYAVVIVYFVVMVLMGWYFSGREDSTEDFFRGGQRVPWWAAGLSIFGTVLSAITFLSIPAMAYRTDWVYLLGNFTVILIAPVVVYFYLPFFRGLNVTSAYEYLELRFSLPVRLFGSLSFILFQLGRVGIVLFLPAMTLSAATGISVITAILVMGLLTILYTALGGIEAVIWTDVVQVLVLLGGAILALVVMIADVDGGFADFVQTAWHDGKFRTFDWTWDYTVAAVWVVLIGRTLENLVPHTSDQSVIQRYLTTPDHKQAARAIWLGNIMALPSSMLFFAIGTALYVFYKEHPHRLDPTLPTDATFPLFIIEQLPPGVTGLIIAALFAAAMSTLDSSLNSVATVVVTDFLRRLGGSFSEKAYLSWARWITVVMGLFGTGAAIVMYLLNSPSMWDQYIRIVGLFGSGLAGLFALGIFTRRATPAGALIGAVVAAAVLATVQHFKPVNFLLYSAIGIVTCFVVGYLASMYVGRNTDLTGLTWHTRRADGTPQPR